MKKYDIVGLILSIILIIFCVVCAVFINRICFLFMIAPICSILFILYKTKRINNE